MKEKLKKTINDKASTNASTFSLVEDSDEHSLSSSDDGRRRKHVRWTESEDTKVSFFEFNNDTLSFYFFYKLFNI